LLFFFRNGIIFSFQFLFFEFCYVTFRFSSFQLFSVFEKIPLIPFRSVPLSFLTPGYYVNCTFYKKNPINNLDYTPKITPNTHLLQLPKSFNHVCITTFPIITFHNPCIANLLKSFFYQTRHLVLSKKSIHFC
jgi:hypothetical protein